MLIQFLGISSLKRENKPNPSHNSINELIRKPDL
jgi:hypothetical protein